MPSIDLGWVGHTVYPPGSSFGPYVASTHEIVWIERGGAVLEVGDRSVSLRPWSIVVSRPGETNLYRWDPDRETHHGWLHLDVRGGLEACPAVHHFARPEVVHGLLSHAGRLERHRPTQWHDLATEAVGYAVRLLVTGTSTGGASAPTPLSPLVERSLLHVVDVWSSSTSLTPPTLRDLAAAVAVTPEHLARAVSRETGHGPLGLLRLVRLRHAASLLARSELTVAAVARRVGFASPFHFSRAFKEEFGTPPTGFRDQPHPGPDLPPAVHELFAAWA